MKQLPDQIMMRRYVLGNVTEEERSALELRLMNDNELYDELSMVEDDLIDDFLAGELTADELEMFESYFLASPDHRGKLRFAKAFREYILRDGDTSHHELNPQDPLWTYGQDPISDPARNWPPVRIPALQPGSEGRPVTPLGAVQMPRPSLASVLSHHPYMRAAAVLVLVFGVTFFGWRRHHEQVVLDQAVQGMNDLWKDYRPIAPLITDMTTHGEVQGVVRGGGGHQEAQTTKLAQIELLLQESDTAEYKHARGEFYLGNGDTARAISLLTSSVQSDSKNAQYHNDLGAAFLQNKEPQKGLDQINEALRLDPSLNEALFNRALAYRGLADHAREEEAWQEYVRKDPNSPWATEAEKNLRSLNDSQSPLSPNQNR
jgi:hypothetical protein